MPMADAIEIVNRNSTRLQVTLKARAGHAQGYFTEANGKKRNFDLDAALLLRTPRFMRLSLSAFGKTQLVFGSNAEKYWMVQPPANALTWGRHDRAVDPQATDLILRPDLLVEALGIAPLPEETAGESGPVQRITPEYQQLFFIDYDEYSQGYIRKEYWLSRYEPQLVARIIFRDMMGRTVMDSRLSQYKPIGRDGPLLPHRIEMRWPATDNYMLFTARGWKLLPDVDETHPGFQFPLDRGATFKHIVDIDVELDAGQDY